VSSSFRRFPLFLLQPVLLGRLFRLFPLFLHPDLHVLERFSERRFSDVVGISRLRFRRRSRDREEGSDRREFENRSLEEREEVVRSPVEEESLSRRESKGSAGGNSNERE
jgi:hypothetical protein